MKVISLPKYIVISLGLLSLGYAAFITQPKEDLLTAQATNYNLCPIYETPRNEQGFIVSGADPRVESRVGRRERASINAEIVGWKNCKPVAAAPDHQVDQRYTQTAIAGIIKVLRNF